MIESNNLTYDAWKEYLKSDKEMNTKWKSLVELGENVKKDLKENLNSLPYSEALRRKKFLTVKNIFNVINTAKEKPDFTWDRKLIYNEEDERDEYVIQCLNPSSDYIFRRIKEERGVASMHGESINKYLQPVADKIWALKNTLRVSIQPESKPSALSYESLQTKKPDVNHVSAENSEGNEVELSQSLERKTSKKEKYVQLTIQFPEDDEPDEKKEDDDPNMDELYKFDPEKEHYWDR